MLKKITLLSACFLISTIAINCFAQSNDSLPKLKLSGYVDAYYAYFTDSLNPASYQKFPSISPRNGFGLNTALLSAQYDAEKVRGIITLHYGDIASSAWSLIFNNIMEAHAGVRLNKTLWLDAGFFRTHVGTEGLHPKENITSSVAIGTFYEPYYQCGARLNYTPNDKLAISVFLLNGYNIFDDNNRKKSFGLLATYALGDKGNVGYNNYIGDDSLDLVSSHLRVYQNVFFNYQVQKLKFQMGLDYGMQKNSDTLGTGTSSMFSGLLAMKYQCSSAFAIYARGEMFNDPQGFLSKRFTGKDGIKTGYKLWGATFGAEYKPTDNSYIRLEGRQLQMDKNQEIFRWDDKNRSSRMEVLLNMGVSF